MAYTNRARINNDRMVPSESIFQHDDDSSELSELPSISSATRRSRKRHVTNMMRGGLTCTKVTVLLVFVASAVAVSVAAYFFSAGEELDDYKEAVRDWDYSETTLCDAMRCDAMRCHELCGNANDTFLCICHRTC